MRIPTTLTGVQRRRTRAFTITEMMISSTLFMIVIGGVIYSHIVGAKMYQLTKAKLGASDQARNAIGLMIAEIRTAKRVDIGMGTQTNFVECTNGVLQVGNAVQIYPTTNYTNPVIRYYLDGVSNRLQRVVNNTNVIDIVADCITNTLPFSSEDYSGNITTENQNNRIIGLSLQFYQIQYPITRIGGGQFYDFYQLRTKIAKRTLE